MFLIRRKISELPLTIRGFAIQKKLSFVYLDSKIDFFTNSHGKSYLYGY
jgi:hypothetical protein